MAEEKKEKVYIGNGKTVKTGNFTLLKFFLSPKDVDAINARATANNGWCVIDIYKRKEPSEKGVTHYGTLNTYKKPEPGAHPVVQSMTQPDLPDEEVPF